MKTIYKYPVSFGEFTQRMPKGAKVLSVQEQNGGIQMWALVDPPAPLEERRFILAGTGHLLPDDAEQRFVGTLQQAGGALVWHLFDLGAA